MTLTQLKYVITIAGENSLNEAAKKLFISQPSLSSAIKLLEDEVGFEVFLRSKTGISLTPKGEEFLGYAKSVMEQYELLDARFVSHRNVKKRFSVSMQHYSFAVEAFIEVVKRYGMDEYEFEIHETKTYEVIENVKNQKSEVGILYLNDFNKNVLGKLFSDYGLRFSPLIECGIYVFVAKTNPLSSKKEISIEELEPYPCLVFDQGMHNSFYYAEEVLSTHEYKQYIKANDRATMLNLMVGLNGFTLCSGIICEDLNGEEYCAIPLKSDEKMTVGYICRREAPISNIGQEYLEEIAKYQNSAAL